MNKKTQEKELKEQKTNEKTNNGFDISLIPEGPYCHGENGICPYWFYAGKIIFHRNLKAAEEIAKAFQLDETKVKIIPRECDSAKDCGLQCWSDDGTNCQTIICGCKYLNYLDENEDTLLWDQCKECGENDDY